MSAQVFAKGTQFGTPESVTVAGQGRLRGVWHRVRAVVAEMYYGTRRVVETQARPLEQHVAGQGVAVGTQTR